MTAVEWLIKELNLEGYDYTIEQARLMEKEKTELSDMDIKKGIKKEWTYSNYQDRHWMEEGAKWYREQLKSK